MLDPDLPAGAQAADLETSGLLAIAQRTAALRRQGICAHGWLQGPPGPPNHPTTVVTCNYCGQVFDTFESAYAARAEILSD
jgi:hypothetical protein